MNVADTNIFKINDIHFFNQDTGIIIGFLNNSNGFHFRTTDGGNSWTLPTPIYPCGRVDKMDFVNDTVGYSIGRDGNINSTTDQGVSWNFNPPVVWGADVNSIININDSVSIIKLSLGSIYRSEDTLRTWTYSAAINCKDYLWAHPTHSFHFINESIGFIAGNGIKKTLDGGVNWFSTNADTNHYYNSIYMLNVLKGFAVGDNGILLKTLDGGQSWNKRFITTQNLVDLTFVNDSIGFCIGGGIGHWNDTAGIILTTIDAGNTWTEEKVSNYGLNAIQFIDSVGYIAGSNGQVFKMPNYNVLDIQKISPQIASLKLWPNPTTDFVDIDIMDGITFWDIEVYNITGELILSKKKTNNNRLSLKSVPNGVYFIQLKSGNTTHIGKVVKE
jgi:photosystem II stability/assembly factor-like uncharacterized protein